MQIPAPEQQKVLIGEPIIVTAKRGTTRIKEKLALFFCFLSRRENKVFPYRNISQITAILLLIPVTS